jgi:hypothetical protein
MVTRIPQLATDRTCHGRGTADRPGCNICGLQVPWRARFRFAKPVSAQPTCHTTVTALRPSVSTSTFALDG